VEFTPREVTNSIGVELLGSSAATLFVSTNVKLLTEFLMARDFQLDIARGG
jgi:hypothetical protein